MSSFHPFDARAHLEKSWRNLPHWQQPDATYFVTFRLADSLPFEVRERFRELRALNAAKRFAWVDGYLDSGSGCCILALRAVGDAVRSTLLHRDGEQYALGAYAIMPNHVHVLVQPSNGVRLRQVMHSWKSYSTHRLQRMGIASGRIWQEESYDRIVRDEFELRKLQAYIMANPAEARLTGGFILGTGSAHWLG